MDNEQAGSKIGCRLNMNKDDVFEEWTKRRSRTFKGFCFLACCLGAEYSIIIPSLWSYIHDTIKAKDAKRFYGITLAVYYMSAIVGSFTITRVVDKTRRVRFTILSLIFCEFIGNVLYSIPLSVYFPLFGRLIQGLGDVNMSIMVAEVARSFEAVELIGKMSTLVTCFSITFIVSPAMNVVFKYVDVTILGWRLNYGNLPGVFMALFFLLVFIVLSINLSDLSREYDLKERRQNAKNTVVPTDEQTVIGVTPPTNSVCERKKDNPLNIIRHFDFTFLILLGFLMSLSVVAFLDVIAPIYGKQYFNFTSRDVGILFFVTGLIFIIVVNIMKKLTKKITEYNFLSTGIFIFMLSTSLLLILSYIKQKATFYSGVSIYISYVVLLGVCWCIEQVLIRTLLSRITPSSCQSFAEGLRRIASSLACIISSLSMPLLLDYLNIVCVVILILSAVAMVVLRLRESTLKRPQVMTL